LYLAVELLGLNPGDEVITAAVTFSTDIAPLVRAGLVPVFVDVEPDTYNIDVDAIEPMIGPATKAILIPNLIGNVPDWDRVRAIADAHRLQLIEDSCDALGATLRGTPTGTRSDISVTSFALSHIITAAGTGGMVCVDDDDLADRCLTLRRWGRRSEAQLFGSRKGENTRFFSTIDDGLEYDNLFIFDEVGWNFEPSELSAAFGLVQLDKLDDNLAARKRNFTRLHERFSTRPEVFVVPRTTEDVDTAWHMFPVLLRPESGVRRGEFQQHMEAHGVDTRMVWTGNALRQPAFKGVAHRAPAAGLPNADRVMEYGVILPSNHGLSDDDVEYIWDTAEAFIR
jgi:CDP-6-deoxy-D-xylo-4-hexulose-3-dehydrase